MIPIKAWRGNEAIVGHWHSEPFSCKVGNRTYTSDKTPRDLKGKIMSTTHDGAYLTLRVQGKVCRFSNQFWKDHNPVIWKQYSKLVVHHLHKQGVPKKDWPLDNDLNNLRGMESDRHLAKHAPEGGRPPAKKARK